ncbi:MAG TPA: MarR family transcriptional regulator [Geothrix sp.]|nr:MarR family transcriptional regulator [Geothrix sp.]
MQELTYDPYSKAGLGLLASAVRRRLKQVAWARLAPYGLTPQQFWVILVLLEEGPLSLHALSQRVWMDDPTASRVVKTLVGRGLLRSLPDPGHGRRILISLMPEALPMARELQTLAQGIKENLVDGLSDQERDLVRHGLMTIIRNLDGQLAEARTDLGEPEGQAAS